MSLTPPAERWRKMAEDARAMAARMRDPEAKRMILEVAANYEKLAVLAGENNAGGLDC
jgi:hypothetical protein